MSSKHRTRAMHIHLAAKYGTGQSLARRMWVRAEELKGSALVNAVTAELLQLASLEIAEHSSLVGSLRAEITRLKRLVEDNCREF